LTPIFQAITIHHELLRALWRGPHPTSSVSPRAVKSQSIPISLHFSTFAILVLLSIYSWWFNQLGNWKEYLSELYSSSGKEIAGIKLEV
jgi:hypothetical protein